MERLTKLSKDGKRYVSAIGSGHGCWTQIIQRLAAYEDTGLTPMQVKALFNYCTLQFARAIMTERKNNPTPDLKEDEHGKNH